MIRIYLISCWACFLLHTMAWGQVETDIFLLSLDKEPDSWTVTEAVNITPRKGYDNQPIFTPEGDGILFVSASSSGDTDIYRYDMVARTSKRITQTKKQSEYSPAFSPDGRYISAVVVERDSSQRIWRYDPLTGEGMRLMEDITGVGYYAWLSKKRMAYFAIGDSITLEWTKIKAEKPKRIASHVGRCVLMHPDGQRLFYVDKSSDKPWMISQWTQRSGSEGVVETMAGMEDFCFTPEGHLLMADGKELYRFRPNADKGWQHVATLPIDQCYRLAMSPDGKYLAVVVFQGQKP